MGETVYAVEIKSTNYPGPKDLRSLKQFGKRLNSPVNRYLFYTGNEYATLGDIIVVPVSALFRGR